MNLLGAAGAIFLIILNIVVIVSVAQNIAFKPALLIAIIKSLRKVEIFRVYWLNAESTSIIFLNFSSWAWV